MKFPTLRDISQAYLRRELSPVEVVRASLDRIEAINPKINAIYHVDREGALKTAAESERRWREGSSLSPFDGIPMSIKDALPAIGMPIYRGSAAEQGVIADTDHPTVARFREAGGVILGKNTMCDYGILASGNSSRHGVTRNPRNTNWNTGASSSGAAAAVAAGIEPVSIGTDIVGSIRIPASYCGLVGLKPSRGRVPYHFPNHPALVAGPLARNVHDAAMLLALLAHPDARDFTALPPEHHDYAESLEDVDPAGVRIAVLPDLGLGATTAPSVRAGIEAAAAVLRTAGSDVRSISEAPFSPEDLDPIELHYLVRCFSEFRRARADLQQRSPFILEWTRRGEELSAADYYDSWNATQRLRERTYRLMDDVDFLLVPSTADTAFEADRLAPEGQTAFSLWAPTCLFNLTEQPAASLPWGTDAAGKPIGLQIVGRRFDDRGVLRLSRYLERHAPDLADASCDTS
ncbi:MULTISPECIES: amidase family protein [unclassified Chelatococcus]|uniref:amidase family protein n=1 Tax=unclassified Chelatococcus TaxID=2638111 RepID=UPI001BCD2684|nr:MULTISPECIES: amidase family protein [unclassified Chelatococcus]MBS7698549.1 amidase [Chelatococcus sp. YT9]MBX3554800.1 amidase [Chelatococcus sp.]